MSMILGLDPGLSGAMALISFEGGEVDFYAFKKLGKELDLRDAIDWLICKKVEYANNFTPIKHAFIEQVSSMPKQGVASTFKFGLTYGMQRGLVEYFNIPYTLVPPRVWTKDMFSGVSGGKEVKAKEKSKIAFSRLFPEFDFLGANKSEETGIVDAMLIAEYGRRFMYNPR